ncbi:MAG: LpqB family beta-propeller domain-containing protein [Thermoanaerobaculia bacterium]
MKTARPPIVLGLLGLLGSLGLLAAIPAAAEPAAAKAPFGTADLFRVRQAREVKVSPDGKAVAFVVQASRTPGKDEDGPAWAELHVAERGRAARPFVAVAENVSRVSFSRDGAEVFFVAKRKGDATAALWSIPRDGGEARRRVTLPADVEGYALSPSDDGVVALLAKEKKAEAVEAREKKGFDREVFEEEWRPVKVWIARLDGEPAPRALDLPGSASELRFAPGGDRLAVALAATPSVDDGYMNRKVHVATLDGKVVGRVEHDGKLGSVAWSPDGTRLALICAADRNDPSTAALGVVSATGGRPKDLLARFDGHPAAFAWAGNDRLVVLAARGVGTELLELPAAGGTPKRLPLPEGLVVDGLDRASDGALAFVAERPDRPAEPYLLAAGAAKPEPLADLNPWLAQRRLGKQSVVRWKARDGVELEGILVEPLERPAGARVPVVLIVHGGPEAHVSNGWVTRYSEPGQLLAAKGIAAFYPNYRGSTGRGLAFSKTSQGDPAGREFDDLVDAADHLISSGLADPKKVGITGGSYGGYAASWGATRLTERFAAAVSFVGITDLTSKAGTTDIPIEDVDVHMLSMPWTRFEQSRERSPLSYVAKARTPLLILHGTADPRVHPTQSLMLYRYLKLAGHPAVRLVRYPGEGHGNRRAASQLDAAVRIVRWFEHFLLGPGGAPPPADAADEAVREIVEAAKK